MTVTGCYRGSNNTAHTCNSSTCFDSLVAASSRAFSVSVTTGSSPFSDTVSLLASVPSGVVVVSVATCRHQQLLGSLKKEFIALMQGLFSILGSENCQSISFQNLLSASQLLWVCDLTLSIEAVRQLLSFYKTTAPHITCHSCHYGQTKHRMTG